MTSPTRLVDTAIFVDYLRGSQVAKDWLNGFPLGELAVSVVTAAELIAGARDRREQQLIESELAFYPMLWISGTISPTAWEWYRKYHLSRGVGFLDCLIGASAYHHGVIVSTLHEKHFRHFPDLRVERPY
jgi:predicted nucleic acid-binding protein